MAIALTQGWQLAVGVKVLGISSAEVLAAQAQREGIEGAVSVVIDAQRNEFYLVRFDLAGPGMTQLEPLRLAQISEIHALQESGARIIGPEAPKHFAGAEGLFPSATILAQLVPQRLDGVPAQDLEPIYLRKTSFVKATQPAARPASQ